MIYVKNKHFKIYSLNENEDYSAKTYNVLTGYTFLNLYSHTQTAKTFSKKMKNCTSSHDKTPQAKEAEERI